VFGNDPQIDWFLWFSLYLIDILATISINRWFPEEYVPFHSHKNCPSGTDLLQDTSLLECFYE